MTEQYFQPLSSRLRPKSFKEFVGQEKVVGKDGFLFQAIKSDQVPSMILWGPPGSGKTTLALIIASETKAKFVQLSAVNSGLKDLRQVVEGAQAIQRLGQKTILFIDEIHRWNKAQQDALLPQVENGVIILIGATTENPSFEINSALLSRAQVVVLERLSELDLKSIIKKAAKKLAAKVEAKALSLIVRLANGDARQALNILEKARSRSEVINIDLVKEVLNRPHVFHDKSGEEHYNLISALHKSMRGNDPDASLYWLARLLEGGEDPIYVARRLVRFASEDIGLANNTALLLANAAFEACQKIGLPECKVHLAHAVIYLAKSKKSVQAYLAYSKVKEEVEKSGNLPVPLHIRNAPTSLMKDLGYSKGYKYTPLEDSSDQDYLPDKLKNKKFID